MRLTPVINPKSLRVKFFYFLSKQYFGKVITPLKVIYARSTPVMMTSLIILSSERKLSLPEETRILIRYYTSHFNDCKFCSNANAFGAAKANLEIQKLKELINYQNSSLFTQKEKSLLAYLEEINTTKNVSAYTFDQLQCYFSEEEIVEITWMNATEAYFNLMAKPLGLESDELKYVKKKDQQRMDNFKIPVNAD